MRTRQKWTGPLAAAIGVVIALVLVVSAGCGPSGQLSSGIEIPVASPSLSPAGTPTPLLSPSPRITVSTPPVISSLTAWADWVSRYGRTEITCAAVDADMDRLTYTWSCVEGIITGTGPTVTWTAPLVPGTYTVSVTVSDKDGAASGDLEVKVVDQLSGPPQIKEIRTFPVNREIGNDKTVTVTCIAFDPDGDAIVEYSWNPIGGTFTGSGATIVWTPPLVPEPTEASILLRITDSRGDRSTGALIRFTVLPVLPCPG